MRNALAVAVLVFAIPSAAPADETYVWWEGESPAGTNFPKRSAFSAGNYPKTRHLLSGGDWLTSSGDRGREELFARYAVAVPAAGEYALWCRKFWKHGPFRWRFGQGHWRVCGRDVALADSATLATHIGANWVHLGEAKLPAGRQTFELRLLAGESEAATACFDCFILTRGTFLPRGKLKPGERSGKADEGFFAWEPGIDPFDDSALLDLRGLNEPVAGGSGRVTYDRATGDFLLGDGKPVRFWAVNVGPNNVEQPHESLDYLAAKLAKLGVNMVRYHGAIFDRADGDPTKVNAKRLDGVHYLVAALKKRGIYAKLSFYFPLWFGIQPGYGLPGYQPGQKPFSLLYFDPRMQQIHRAWAKALLTAPNPYTGVPLGKDPAVAIVEIVNEDSLFFWTFSKKNVPDPHWTRLEERFSAWLAKRHGSLAKAYGAWGGRRGGDTAKRAGLLDAWFMTRDGVAKSGVPRQRISDQVRFLAELQRGYYADTVAYLREEIGYAGLVSCSNWKTADAEMLDALERYTYAAGDVIDRHGYFGGKHEGEGSSYSVRVGHTFADRPAVREPQSMPFQVVQVERRPHIVSELGWPTPNRRRSDATLLAAAYGRLQGLDGLFWFAVGSNYLADRTMNKFPVSTPAVAGTFPATALLYRRGDVRTPQPVVRRVLALDDLYALKGSGGAAAEGFDKLRDPGSAAGTVAPHDGLAFFVGPVLRTFGTGAKPVRADLRKFIDPGKRVVRSATGELVWDFGRGVVTVNTPRCKAVAGFLGKAGPLDAGGMTFECGNEYASIVVISLDDKPLAESGRILIQAMAEDRPYGFRAARGRITAMGGAPMNVREIDGAVTLRIPHLKSEISNLKTVALDENGYATDRPVSAERAPDDRVRIQLRPDTVYTIMTRDAR